ncbi:hypothetical protein JCM10213_009049 [Rhodosporidiobolus nylandii]
MVSGRTTPLNGARRQSMLLSPADGSSSVKVGASQSLLALLERVEKEALTPSLPSSLDGGRAVVRIRPNTGSDAAAVPTRFQRPVIHSLSSTSLQAENAGPSTSAKSTFSFDRVITPDEGQPHVYECAAPLVDSFLAGMNTTILAYGQTSSGKSYTMGTDRLVDEAVGPERLGITPRAVQEIFERLSQTQREAKGGFSFAVKVSYVELYQEEIRDLLVGDTDARPTVQIREDKQGHIVWQGLREVKVSSASDVMDLLADGSALRQTGATQANSQSSRSHAIFSLSLTQKKWTGTGPPPSSTPSSPQSPRVTNRLSQLPRSPAMGGRSTPTADRPGSRSGLRPPSQIGRPQSPLPANAEEPTAANGVESWTTLSSKLHLVDLAGSERLKRTAAAGERAREGISINSGLSALGNVISALGDPTKKATHVPYRDSKLTRLLQDSLGGNSKTMMVACISPTEYNLHETMSTLQYANRARNIRNHAQVNEVEAGWDDVDHLQKSILKLRAELASIRSGDAPAISAIAEEGLRNGGPTSTEVELQQKVAQLTADLAKAQSGEAASLSRDDFARAVEPIVEEYERSLSALESQLSLTKAALIHSEDEMRELEARVDEEAKANEANEALIDDLRSRVAKLSERESTTEAYVRDLEARLREVDDAGDAHGLAVSDLRKELARNREQADKTELYIKELESRLGKADESNAELKRQIEVLSRDVERREEAHRELEQRVSLLDTSNEQKLLLAEIDEKDRRVLELERALGDLKSQVSVAEEETQRLQKAADEEKSAKEELESQVRTLERAAVVRRSAGGTSPRPAGDADEPAARGEVNGTAGGASEDSELVASLQQQVEQLQAAHAETLSELEQAKAKYRESLKEIEDLNSQAQEAKLLRSQRSSSDLSDTAPSPASATFPNGHSGQRGDGLQEEDDEVEELAYTSSRPASRAGSPTATRTTPRSPHVRRSMPLSPGGRLSFLGQRGGGSSSQHLRSASLSQSLSQELSLAALSPSSSPTSTRPVSPSPGSHARRDSLFGGGLFSPTGPTTPSDRSYEQVKEEVIKLQTALNEREAEISSLETTIQQLRSPPSAASPPAPPFGPDSASPVVSVHLERPATPPRRDISIDDLNLSPRTLAAFSSLKAGLNGTSTGLGLVDAIPSDAAVASALPSADEAEKHAARLDDLMRSMAQKESSHREAVESLEDRLSGLQRQHDELTVLSRDQVVNMSSEIEQLRVALESRPEKGVFEAQLQKLEEDLASKGRELEVERLRAEETLEKAKREAVEEHQRHLEATIAEHDATLQRLREEHAVALEQAAVEREEAAKQQQDQHTAALEALSAQHAEALQAKDAERDAALQQQATVADATRQRAAAELDETVKRLEGQLAAFTAASKEEVDSTVKQLRDEHATAVSRRQVEVDGEMQRLQQEHAAALQSQSEEHAQAMSKLREEHEAALAVAAESARGGSTEEHSVELASLREKHAAALERSAAELSARHAGEIEALAAQHDGANESLRAAHRVEVEELGAKHAAALQSLADGHAVALSTLRDEHAQAVTEVKQQHEATLEHLRASLVAEHSSAVDAMREEHEATLLSLRDEHSSTLDSLRAEHLTAVQQQQEAQAVALATASSSHDGSIRALEAERDKAKSDSASLSIQLERLNEQLEAQKLVLAASSAEQKAAAQRALDLTQQHEAASAEVAALRQALEQRERSAPLPATNGELQEALDALNTLERALQESQDERERLLAEVQQLKGGEVDDRSKYDTVFRDLEQSRASVTRLDLELAKTRKERDSLSAQLARQSLSSNPGLGIMSQAQSLSGDSTPQFRAMSPDLERATSPPLRATSPPLRSERFLSNGSTYSNPPLPPPSVPPPPAPAPTMPPPPAPLPNAPLPPLPPSASPLRTTRSSSTSSASGGHARGSISESTPATSVRSGTDSQTIDPRILERFKEQEMALARLTKQLAQKEADLQAQLDLANTLDQALNDSERNLRKARLQSNEYARERDQFKADNERLRIEAQDSHTTSESYRQSVVDLETRLQHERDVQLRQERARQELEGRLGEVNRRKQSKFACF